METIVDTLALFIFAEVSNKQLIFWESFWQAIKSIQSKCFPPYPPISANILPFSRVLPTHLSLLILSLLPFPPCSIVCVCCRLSGHLEVCVRCSACITVLGEEVGKLKGHFCVCLSGRMTERQQARLKMSLHINAPFRCQSRKAVNIL